MPAKSLDHRREERGKPIAGPRAKYQPNQGFFGQMTGRQRYHRAVRFTTGLEVVRGGEALRMSLDDVLVILLAGGAGERLHPLTAERAKPAVYFGGPYRIVDFTLSNCITRVCAGFHRHSVQVVVAQPSHPHGVDVVSEELGEFIELLPPQKRVGEHWYLGTADAVFQNLYSIVRESPSHVVVLSGDHVYKMDYSKMLRFHLDKGADATLAARRCRSARGGGSAPRVWTKTTASATSRRSRRCRRRCRDRRTWRWRRWASTSSRPMS